MGHYDGKLVIITGAAGGIGRECIPIYAAQGARLHLIDVTESGLADAAKLAGTAPVTTRVSRLSSPEECAAAIAGADGPIHALVHLAGIFRPDTMVADDRRQVFDPVIAANLTNAYDMAIACLPRFASDLTPRAVFISSLAFRRGAPMHTAYAAAKGGLAGLTRSLARRLAPNVLVNALAPGLIDTPMPAELIAEKGPALLRDIPLKRFGHPREVASVIEFLTGPGSSYITGQIINVDGGIVPS